MSVKLTRDFYARNAVDVARDLIGAQIVHNQNIGIITETEAYRSFEDEASHAFKGPTKRSAIMFGPPGVIYVYMIYGMHYCLNIIAEPEGQGAGVLIRSIDFGHIHIQGPGRVCKFLNITTADNGINCLESKHLYLNKGEKTSYITTPRIGINKATTLLWRFVQNLTIILICLAN